MNQRNHAKVSAYLRRFHKPGSSTASDQLHGESLAVVAIKDEALVYVGTNVAEAAAAMVEGTVVGTAITSFAAIRNARAIALYVRKRNHVSSKTISR